MASYIDILFHVRDRGDGPVTQEFVEVEDAHGNSIRVGDWVTDQGASNRLRIPDPRRIAQLEHKLATAREAWQLVKITLTYPVDTLSSAIDLDAALANDTKEFDT